MKPHGIPSNGIAHPLPKSIVSAADGTSVDPFVVKTLFAATVLSLFAAMPAEAAVNDVFPADYAGLLVPGTWNFTSYAYDRSLQGPYRAGQPAADVKVRSRIGALRLSRAFDVAGTTVAPLVVVSGADVDSNRRLAPFPYSRGSGFGDLRFGGTVWLLNDRANRRGIGLSGLAAAPTGTYDSRSALNAGENRWRWVATAGWVEGIGERLTVDLFPELAWYGRNDAYAGNNRLSQDMTWAVTGYLRWRAEDRLQLFVGGQLNGGGATRINGVDQNNPAESSRLYIGGMYNLTPSTAVNVRFGRDLAVENGLKMRHDLALRLVVLFGP